MTPKIWTGIFQAINNIQDNVSQKKIYDKVSFEMLTYNDENYGRILIRIYLHYNSCSFVSALQQDNSLIALLAIAVAFN